MCPTNASHYSHDGVLYLLRVGPTENALSQHVIQYLHCEFSCSLERLNDLGFELSSMTVSKLYESPPVDVSFF